MAVPTAALRAAALTAAFATLIACDASDAPPPPAPEEPNAITVADQTITVKPPKVSITAKVAFIPAYLVLADADGTILGYERVWEQGPRAYPVDAPIPKGWSPVTLTAHLFAADGNQPDLTRPLGTLAGQPVRASFNVIHPPVNTLDVRDQTLQSWGHRIRIENLATDELPAWVVVMADEAGAPGEVLGTLAVDSSPKVSLMVDLTRFVEPEETLWVGLRRDLEPLGTFGDEDVAMSGDGASPLVMAIQVTNEACGGPTTKFCDPAKPSVIRWRDRCGEVVATETDCGDRICDDTGLFVACRPAPDPCADDGALGCVAEDETAVWRLDACGAPRRVVERCGAFARCVEADGEAACAVDPVCAADPADPACTLPGPCVGAAYKFCDPADPGRIHWMGPCGEPLTSTIPCGATSVCDESTGEARCVLADSCGGNVETVCVEEDPGQVYWTDACGELTGSTYPCGVASCDESGGEATCTIIGTCEDTRLRVCDEADPSLVRLQNACGDDLGVFTTCANGKACVEATPGEASCECVPTDRRMCYGTSKLYEPSGIVKVDSCGIRDGAPEVECLDGEVCEMTDDGPACGASLTNRDAPMYHRGCSFPDYLRFKTDLDVDCRCRRHAAALGDVDRYDMGGNLACQAQADSIAAGWTVGAGPRLTHMTLSQNGGGALGPTGELFATRHFTDANYQGAGMVVAYHIRTGARRIVSGRFPEADGSYTMVGSGFESARSVGTQRFEATTLPGAWDLELGPDGQLYVWGSRDGNKEITRVDPTTGARTLVWRQALEFDAPTEAPAHGQCYSIRQKATFFGGLIPVSLENHAFAMGPDGSFYLGFRNESAEGNGIVRIAADGSTCTVISRWNGDMGLVGGGASPPYSNLEGFFVRGGELYATLQIGKHLLVVDLTTGDRRLIANAAGSVGSTPGQSTMFWDETRDLLITAGGVQPYLGVAVDVATGFRQAVFLSAPGMPIESAGPWEMGARGAIDNGNTMAYGAMAMDPEDPDHLFLVVKFGLIKYEMSTGNSYVMSQ